MTYTRDFGISLGASYTGTVLNAQIVSTAGASVGSVISTGFVEIGTGNYLLHATTIPKGHRGGIKFYATGSPTTILAFSAINPEENEIWLTTGYVMVTGTVPAVVGGYVTVTGTPDVNVEKWNTVDVVSNAIPIFAAGTAGGLATVDANNYIAGIQGTKNQLDDLNDIAAGAQMDLVNAPNAIALNAIADAQLVRDWTAIVGAVPSRSQLNALRFLRNKWSVAGGVLTVTQENDTTTAWTGAVTSDAAADNITAVDPA